MTWQGYLVVLAIVLATVLITTLGHRDHWNPALYAIIPVAFVVALSVYVRR